MDSHTEVMRIFPGKRILVLGCSGSGKSTFATRLQKITGLPLHHLDNIWWKLDHTHITREEFDKRLEALLKEEAWILDGDYSRTYEMRIRSCDTVFFLDYSMETCMNGIVSRVGKTRKDIPWVEQELSQELVELVKNYRDKQRPELLALLEKHSEKHVIIFHDRQEAEEWLVANQKESCS